MKKILTLLFSIMTISMIAQTGNILSVTDASNSDSVSINVDDVNVVYQGNTYASTGATIIYGTRGSRLESEEPLSSFYESTNCQLVPVVSLNNGDSLLINKDKIRKITKSRDGNAIIFFDKGSYYGTMGSTAISQETHAVVIDRIQDCPYISSGGGSGGCDSLVYNFVTENLECWIGGSAVELDRIPNDWVIVKAQGAEADDYLQAVYYANGQLAQFDLLDTIPATGVEFVYEGYVYYTESGKIPNVKSQGDGHYSLYVGSGNAPALFPNVTYADTCHQKIYHVSNGVIFVDVEDRIICPDPAEEAAALENLYNADGTLTGIRDVDLSTFDLFFGSTAKPNMFTMDASSGRIGVNAAPNETFGQLHVKSDNIGADGAVLSLADNTNAQIFRVRNDGGVRANTYAQGTQGWEDLGVNPTHYTLGISDNGTFYEINGDTIARQWHYLDWDETLQGTTDTTKIAYPILSEMDSMTITSIELMNYVDLGVSGVTLRAMLYRPSTTTYTDLGDVDISSGNTGIVTGVATMVQKGDMVIIRELVTDPSATGWLGLDMEIRFLKQ